MTKIERQTKDEETPASVQRLAEVGKMTAFIAHEVKNSLVTIGGLARLVRRALPDMKREQERLDAIMEEVHKLEDLTHNVMSFAHAPGAERRSEDINNVIAEAMSALAGQVHGKRITFNRRTQPNVPQVEIDRVLMRQVILNLLHNAIEAIETEGVITVGTSVADGTVEIVVADTGKGMPPEMLENLFQLFQTNKPTGTGFGLWVAHDIIRAHNGTIQVCSEEGKGSEFKIRLPAAGTQ